MIDVSSGWIRVAKSRYLVVAVALAIVVQMASLNGAARAFPTATNQEYSLIAQSRTWVLGLSDQQIRNSPEDFRKAFGEDVPKSLMAFLDAYSLLASDPALLRTIVERDSSRWSSLQETLVKQAAMTLASFPEGPVDNVIDDILDWISTTAAKITGYVITGLGFIVAIVGGAVGLIALVLGGPEVAIIVGAALAFAGLVLGFEGFLLLALNDLADDLPPAFVCTPLNENPAFACTPGGDPSAVPASVDVKATTPLGRMKAQLFVSIVDGLEVKESAKITLGHHDPSKTQLEVAVHEDPDYCVEDRPIVNGIDGHIGLYASETPTATITVGAIDPTAVTTCFP